jgi:hypothetical protein
MSEGVEMIWFICTAKLSGKCKNKDYCAAGVKHTPDICCEDPTPVACPECDEPVWCVEEENVVQKS